MPPRRAGLWVEIALALALVTLTIIVLDAGVFWLLLQRAETDRRTDLALALSSALTAQLEVEASSSNPSAGYRRVLASYKDTDLDVDQLYVVDPTMKVLASVAGSAPRTPDAGFRAAIYGRTQDVSVSGSPWGRRQVVVTSPVAPAGRPVAALRVALPLQSSGIPGGPAAFFLGYTVFSGAAVGLFGFTLMRRRLVGPIGRLQEGTMRIAGGEFGYTVEIDAARELQEMSGALNTMSASLAAYRERTRRQVQELEQANNELREARDALVRSEKLASVGRLAAGLAHEVGNPLAAVLGYVELLCQGLDDPAMERDLLERSRRELERIHRIIRELLDYARQGSGAVADVSVDQALAEAARTVRLEPRFRDIEVEVQAAPDLPAVRIEPDKLHQVLVNLLLNAADAVAEGRGGRVRLEAVPAEGGVEIRCEDDGPGFSEVALKRAFEPFFTTKEVGKGTGLGLATCLQVVEGAGGAVRAENREEGGARVRVILPATPESSPTEPA